MSPLPNKIAFFTGKIQAAGISYPNYYKLHDVNLKTFIDIMEQLEKYREKFRIAEEDLQSRIMELTWQGVKNYQEDKGYQLLFLYWKLSLNDLVAALS